MSDRPYTVRTFLDAITTVDDRTLSTRVLDRLTDRVTDLDEPRVIEIGAGRGAMPLRLVNRGVLPDGTRYTGIDKDPALVAAARDHLIEQHTTSQNGGDLHRNNRTIHVTIEQGDGYAAIERSTWDLIIVNAVPPRRDISNLVSHLTAHTTPMGMCYIPLAYDGVTEFVPAHPLDETVLTTYHASLTDTGGTSHLGRSLIDAIQATASRLIAVAGADRIIHPANDAYPDDEEYVLRHTINAMESITPGPDFSPEDLTDWAADRRHHIDSGELTYIAHGLDLLFEP